ncbi:MAG: fluoride efflux transporter CrcB [Actinobacteria bacterium]|nr:fluoride efflux transporter CrcB [Actinomycetota bacterium]
MVTALWVGVGGFFGAVSRYLVSGWARDVDEVLPWGTFAVNISGSLLLGYLVGAFGVRSGLSPDIRIALTVGFIGAYTTFSTLMLETFELGETRAAMFATLNLVGSIALGLLAVWVGLTIGRSIGR